jgi:hypothetical protein
MQFKVRGSCLDTIPVLISDTASHVVIVFTMDIPCTVTQTDDAVAFRSLGVILTYLVLRLAASGHLRL